MGSTIKKECLPVVVALLFCGKVLLADNLSLKSGVALSMGVTLFVYPLLHTKLKGKNCHRLRQIKPSLSFITSIELSPQKGAEINSKKKFALP